MENPFPSNALAHWGQGNKGGDGGGAGRCGVWQQRSIGWHRTHVHREQTMGNGWGHWIGLGRGEEWGEDGVRKGCAAAVSTVGHEESGAGQVRRGESTNTGSLVGGRAAE